MDQRLSTLVAEAKKGDAHAFAALYETIYKELYRFAYCTLKDPHLAEDVVSDSVLCAYENIHKLRKNESFRSWIFQITANECKKQFCSQKKVIPLEHKYFPKETESGSDPAGHLLLKQAFDTLNEQERLAVGLSLYGGYSGREIAHFLRKKEGTVRSMKSRALEKMKRFLEVTENE
ncbi:MAG: RNA polymerase sigma factor [Roseburia sp.]|nr:RNA polymerase sigma factor [Roseburia sp.]